MPSQEARDCGKDHSNQSSEDDKKTAKKVSDSELDAIIDRLYTTQTKSSGGCSGYDGSNSENDGKKKTKTQEEVDNIVERLYTMKTEAMKDHSDEALQAEDSISKKNIKGGDVDMIVDRLFTSHTVSSQGDKKAPKPKNEVARKPATEEEMKEIYERLLSTHTKSSSGAGCKSVDEPKTLGLGQKMLPIIAGLETRFRGKQLSKEQADEIMQRLLTTQTKTSKARKDFPKILLYPERTILHNNTERIKSYQDSGNMTRQKELARREKWFN